MPSTVNMQSHIRTWFQPGGGSFDSPLLFGGADMSTISIDGASGPVLGGIDTNYEYDPFARGQYLPVSRSGSPPDNSESNVMIRERKGGIPRSYYRQDCGFSLYELITECGDAGDFLAGWDDYTMVYPNGRVTSRDYGARGNYTDDNILEHTLAVTWEANPFQVGRMNFALSQTTAGSLAIDITYHPKTGCVNCGVDSDGTKWLYQANKATTGQKPTVKYSLDGGATWTSLSIAAAANDEQPQAIAVVQNYLIVLSRTAGGVNDAGYYISPINQFTGVPSSTFTKITAGFVTSKQPNDMEVLNNTLWFAADGGYIYKSDNPLAGVVVMTSGTVVTDNLLRIAVSKDTILASGANSAFIYSDQTGLRWIAPGASPTVGAVSGSALAIRDRYYWLSGHNNGTLYYTKNGGQSWTQYRFSGDGAGTVQDILVVNNHVIWFAHASATPTVTLWSSWNGGRSFTNTSPRISGLPNFNAVGRLAAPQASSDLENRINTLAIAGTKATGTDGGTFIGSSPII